MRLVIYGSRDVDPTIADITNKLNDNGISEEDIEEVVCGMARGADLAGKRWAEAFGIPVAEFPAEWDRYGKSAGYIRNRQMAKYATHGLGFWKGESRGTAHMTTLLVASGRPAIVVSSE